MKFDFRKFIIDFAYSFGAGCCAVVFLWFIISFVSWKSHIFGAPLLFFVQVF